MPAIPERQALRQVVVDSLCLRDNPLGDPHVRRFPVVWTLAPATSGSSTLAIGSWRAA